MRKFFCFLLFTPIIAPTQELTIEYIAHASFKLSYEGSSLLIDPYADTIWIGYRFPKNIKANAVLISHPHYDHDGGRFRGITPYWESQMEIIEDPGKYEVGAFKIRGISGKHSDPYGKEFGQKNIIWLIEVAGITLVHLGDNEGLQNSHYQAIDNPDILFAPIDGDYHILKEHEIAVVVNNLMPRILVPMHYRLPDLEDPGFPKGGLGEIDPYLNQKQNVVKLESHRLKLAKNDLPNSWQIMVFQHSPDVTR